MVGGGGGGGGGGLACNCDIHQVSGKKEGTLNSEPYNIQDKQLFKSLKELKKEAFEKTKLFGSSILK